MPMPTLEETTSELLQTELGLPVQDATGVAHIMRPVERFRASAALRVMQRARTPFEIYFCAESFVASNLGDKCTKMKQLFVQRLGREDKIELLSSWAFAEQRPFGESRGPVRHVMYSDCAADSAWLTENTGQPTFPDYECSAGLNSGCACVGWLRHHPAGVDPALEALVGHLCDMRNSMVHQSWPVFMVTELIDVPGLPPADGASMLDCYPSDTSNLDRFRTYESGIPLARFRAIVQSALRAEVLTRNL